VLWIWVLFVQFIEDRVSVAQRFVDGSEIAGNMLWIEGFEIGVLGVSHNRERFMVAKAENNHHIVAPL
jgi:hypothetical protein